MEFSWDNFPGRRVFYVGELSIEEFFLGEGYFH
jgi:hypothetical protein